MLAISKKSFFKVKANLFWPANYLIHYRLLSYRFQLILFTENYLCHIPIDNYSYPDCHICSFSFLNSTLIRNIANAGTTMQELDQ